MNTFMTPNIQSNWSWK